VQIKVILGRASHETRKVARRWRAYARVPDGSGADKAVAQVLRADGTPRPLDEAPPFRALRGQTLDGVEEIDRDGPDDVA